MPRALRYLIVLSSVALAAATIFGDSSSPLLAADDPPAKKKKGNGKPLMEEWKQLVNRRKELMKEVESLDKQARSPEGDKQKITKRFQELELEFRSELQPRIVELAPQVYEKDPTDVEAVEILIGKAYQENKYKQVIEMADSVLEKSKSSAPLLTLKGISQFATANFEGAKETLTKAQESDREIFPRLGGPFLEACDEYIAYWKKEQAIRAKEAEADDLPRVLFKTTKGDIEIELFENEAPNTVANFVSLVESKKYDGTAFHRVIPNFMAQGGDPNTLDDDPGNDGQGGPGYTIACECFSPKARMHFQGSLSMAHAGKDTGGSQFFMTHLPTAHLNYVEGKEGSSHTVFGRVIKGMDIALAIRPGDKIESAEVVRKRDHEYKPKTSPEKRPGRAGKK